MIGYMKRIKPAFRQIINTQRLKLRSQIWCRWCRYFNTRQQ